MCPGESAGRSAGQGGPQHLASAILARIIGGDLPPGAELDPSRLSHLFQVTEPEIRDALHLLTAQGAVETDADCWRVARGGGGQGAGLLQWVVPLMRSVVALAAARISPAEAAGVLAAYDRHVGLSGDGSVESRMAGYRQMMERLAAASGSRFHAASLKRILDEAEPFLARIVSHQLATRRIAEPDDELGRLAQAMMQGNSAAAAAALDDHLILLGRYLACLEQIRG